jgi:HK97 gp10 family phage protein
MSKFVDIVFSGEEKLRKALNSLSKKDLRKFLTPAIRKGLKPVRDQAKANVPRDTGLLEKSIRQYAGATRSGEPKGRVVAGTKVGFTAEGKTVSSRSKKAVRKTRAAHAHLVEFGTVKMPARPFLRPALENRKREAFNIIVEESKKGFKQAFAALGLEFK